MNALDLARRMVLSIVETEAAQSDTSTQAEGIGVLLRGKVVGETAMLLHCVEPVKSLDDRIREQADVVASLLMPHARHKDVLAAICLDPGLALDHAAAHVVLSRLGFPEPAVDNLLSKSMEMGLEFGPERLPHRKLERAWLARVWRRNEPTARHDSGLVADSMLGRPMDVLGSTRLDIYAFTHAVMYASDFGRQPLSRARSRAAIVGDADAALAQSLDSNDFDLTAEVVLTWPMLGLPWSSAATFAFGILAGVEDSLGFLPGLAFDSTRHQELTGEARSRFAMATSYHAVYVLGFLCAAALREGHAPPAAVPPARRSRGAGAALLSLVRIEKPTSCWQAPIEALAPRQQDALAGFVLTVLLRRARARGDLRLVREALQLALTYDLVEGPAPRQAAALLRRAHAVNL